MGGGLFDQEIHLSGDIDGIPQREVLPRQFVPDPVNDGQGLLIDDLSLEIVPTHRAGSLRCRAFVGRLTHVHIF